LKKFIFFIGLLGLITLITGFIPRSLNITFEKSEFLKADGAIKGSVQLPKKALRKVIRKRRSRGYSRSVLRQAKKAKQYNEFEKTMIYLIPLEEKNYYQRDDVTILSQKNVNFDPAHVVIQKNTQLNILNRDNIFHNVFSNSDVKQFNVGKVPKNVDKVISFESVGHIQVFCDIHAFMSSIISIVDTPYFTTCREDGSFELRDIPPGKYRLVGWHSRAEFRPATVEIKSGRFSNVKKLVFN
jgi:plastocyanin